MSLPANPSPEGPIWQFEPNPRIEQPACSPDDLAQRLRAHAAGLGLVGLGFAAVEPFAQAEQAFRAWIDAGYQGTMDYMVSDGARSDPSRLAAKSTTMVVAGIATVPPANKGPSLSLLGQVAAYAKGADYHGILRQKLSALGQLAADHSGHCVNGRACVDTAPFLEREAARRSGLGFIGKSNMLIVPGIGSQVLLGVLLVDIAISPDVPREQRCGRCTACLTACPTQAFVRPWLLDARRCIAYLTIEYKGWIAHELRPLIGTRIFGCDVCQDVCPFNHGKAEPNSNNTHDVPIRSETTHLSQWLRLSSSGYRRLTAGTAIRRASRWQLLRNAAVAAGNSADETLIAPLTALLLESTYAIVRGHAAWALGRYRNPNAVRALTEALEHEVNAQVVSEIESALE